MKSFIFAFLASVSFFVNAKTTTIIYVNGINTSSFDARLDAEALKNRYCESFGCNDINFVKVYNDTQDQWDDIGELKIMFSAENEAIKYGNGQVKSRLPGKYKADPYSYIKGTDEYNLFMTSVRAHMYLNYETWELKYKDFVKQDWNVINTDPDVANVDIMVSYIRLYKEVERLLGKNFVDNVIIVPHSQGNYLAQAVKVGIDKSYPDYSRRLSVLGIASVSSIAQHENEYVTIRQDRALGLHRTKTGFVVKPNFDAGWRGDGGVEAPLSRHPRDEYNHSMINVYMNSLVVPKNMKCDFGVVSLFDFWRNRLDYEKYGDKCFGLLRYYEFRNYGEYGPLVGVGSEFPLLRGVLLDSHIAKKINDLVVMDRQPKADSFHPTVAKMGEGVLFKVSGRNLKGSVIKIPGAVCTTPQYSLDGSELRQRCTMSDSSGKKMFQVVRASGQKILESEISVRSDLVEGVFPKDARLGSSVLFTVRGQNLPATAVMSIADAECQAPTQRKPDGTGFTQTCTLKGAPGLKAVKIKTDTDANGGQIIEDALSVRALPAAAPVTAGKVPHTGITAQQCYKKGSNALVACNSAEAIALSNPGKQDGMRGHINTMSYSEVPGFARTECVKDNLTGLMWEGKTNDGGLRDGSKRYTNYADGRAGSALDYVNQVNAQGLCGHHDWRLPTVDELHSLVDFSKPYPGPTIDTAWFPNTAGTDFWSGTPYAGNPANAWDVHFGVGGAHYYDSRGYQRAVRLVRASQ